MSQANIDRWVPVTEGLPEVPEDHSRCSDDVIAALIQNDEIVEWEKTYVSAFGKEWHRGMKRLSFIPTHWRPVPSFTHKK